MHASCRTHHYWDAWFTFLILQCKFLFCIIHKNEFPKLWHIKVNYERENNNITCSKKLCKLWIKQSKGFTVAGYLRTFARWGHCVFCKVEPEASPTLGCAWGLVLHSESQRGSYFMKTLWRHLPYCPPWEVSSRTQSLSICFHIIICHWSELEVPSGGLS